MLLMKKEELKELMDARTGPCVSIYMPTVRSTIETRQNPIRFRKLLAEAEHKLAASAVRRPRIEELTSSCRTMLEDNLFWQYQMGGPLALAGVDYLTRIYEKANTYPRVCDGRITGNPDGLRPEVLRDRAWELVKPGFEAGTAEAVRRYMQLQGTPRAANHIKTILQAANDGRVGELFVSARDQRWGVFEDNSGVMEVHHRQAPGDLDLLELCAARTLEHGGQVYALEPERMPGAAPAAAIFRY